MQPPAATCGSSTPHHEAHDGSLRLLAWHVLRAHLTRQRPDHAGHRSQVVCGAQLWRRVDAAQDRRMALGQCPFRTARMESHGTHRLSSNCGEADDHAVALRWGRRCVRATGRTAGRRGAGRSAGAAGHPWRCCRRSATRRKCRCDRESIGRAARILRLGMESPDVR